MSATSRSLLEVHASGPVTHATFTAARLDESNLYELGQELAGLVERPGQLELHLDFRAVEALSSAVLGKLVRLHQRVGKAGGRLVLLQLSPFLRDLFHLTRLDSILDVRAAAPDERGSARASA